MPYLVQSKGRLLHLRDGDGPDRPLYVVDDRRWYPFERLPSGVRPEHDSDAHYRMVDSVEGIEPAPVYEPAPAVKKSAKTESEAAPAATKRKPKVRHG